MEATMRRISILLLIFFTFGASAAWSQAQPQWKHKIVTFDVPGAGTGAGQGTLPIGIVQGGWIMGSYIDANSVSHGFLRAPDGTITKFDVPGAGKGAGQGTIEVFGMTPGLEIVGTYADANNVHHGFLRTLRGKFTTFDAPFPGTAGTGSLAVNWSGLILAEYLDANGAYHGLLRAPDGTFTTFDPPDAGTGAGQGTYSAIFSGINPEGACIGEYVDANNVFHAYLRAPDGTITEFDDPNAGTGTYQGTGTSGINPAGEINGWYIDTNNVFHGFLRSLKGDLTEVDVPGAGTGTYQGTDAAPYMPAFGGINPAGTITGFYADANSVYHGYLRSPQGKFVTFDVRGAGTGNWQGTLPLNINPEGTVTGWYIDQNGVYHGFLRMP
jgi:hypothetical protein